MTNFRARRKLGEVVFGAQLLQMLFDVRRVTAHPLAPFLLPVCLSGMEVGRHGSLGVNDDGASSRKMDDHVRADPVFFSGTGLLRGEIAIFHHARQFHHTAKLEFSPLAAGVVMVQGLGKPGCFVLQGLIAGKDVAYLGFQVRISAHALLFYFSQAGLDQLEGVTHRLEQGLNGLLSGFQIMPSLLVLVLETRFRQIEELFFRVAKDFRTDAGKGIPAALLPRCGASASCPPPVPARRGIPPPGGRNDPGSAAGRPEAPGRQAGAGRPEARE